MAGEHRDKAGAPVFTLPELAELSGTDYRTLHNWQRRGILRPSHREANGSGTVSLFDSTDALQVLVLTELRQSGVEVRVLGQIASQIRELASTMASDDLLLIYEQTVVARAPADLHNSISLDRPNVVLNLSRARGLLDRLSAAA